MKKLLAVSLLAASTANAGVYYDLRFDHTGSTYNEDHGGKSSGKFTAQTARFGFKGKFSDELSYSARIAINKDPSTKAVNDNLSQNIELANVTHKMSDMISLTLGKMSSGLGGFEAATSGADTYLSSYGRDAIFSGIKDKNSGDIFFKSAYLAGAKATANVGGHAINLVAFNSTEDSADQTRYLSGLSFEPVFMEGALKAIVSYHTQKASAMANAFDKDTTTTYTTVGVKYTDAAWFAQLDYNMFAVNKATYNDGTTDLTESKITLDGAVVEAGYMMDAWTVKAKVDSSTLKAAPATGTAAKTTMSSMMLVGEWTPSESKDFRYHAGYGTKTKKEDFGAKLDKNQTETQVIVGVRLMADVLK